MNVLVVDDHRLFLDGLRYILGKLDDGIDVNVLSSYTKAEAVLPQAEQFDLILLDLNVDGGDGVALMIKLRELGIFTPVVAVSATDDPHHIQSALDAGASGFVPKSLDANRMIAGLRRVLAGDQFVPSDIQAQLTAARQRDRLTKKQKTVLELLCEGLTNRQIAEHLCLTEHTVKSHLLALYDKLGVNNRTECVIVSQQKKLVRKRQAP
jgi:DNA-binding NarL/FixJ family response regulator